MYAVFGSKYIAYRDSPKYVSQSIIPGCLPGTHLVYRHPIGKQTGGVNLYPVLEHRNPDSSGEHRIVTVNNCIHDCLKHGSQTVLGIFFAGRCLPCRNAHISAYELHCIGNLYWERSLNLFGIQLRRSTILTTIHRGHYGSVWNPILRRIRT